MPRGSKQAHKRFAQMSAAARYQDLQNRRLPGSDPLDCIACDAPAPLYADSAMVMNSL
jgi:hypothetical protein